MLNKIIDASRRGDLSEIKSLLEQGASLDGGDSLTTTTPLHQASQMGHVEVVKLLLKRGASVRKKDSMEFTPMHRAASKGQEAVVALLLEEGAPIDPVDRDGYTPLHEAAMHGQEGVALLLLRAGAKSELKNNIRGYTPLHAAVHDKQKNFVELVLSQGYNLETRSQSGNTLAHTAAAEGHTSILELLLDQKSDFINALNTDKETPLHCAARRGQEGTVRLLLKRGAKVNVRDIYESAPLNGAALTHRKTVIKILLAHGAYLCKSQKIEEKLKECWEDNLVSNLSFYTALLLAGMEIPEGPTIPEPIVTRLRNINAMVTNWLSPLKPSDDVDQKTIIFVLRALPTLLDWMHQIKTREKLLRAKQKKDTSFKTYQEILKEILWLAPTDEKYFLSKKKQDGLPLEIVWLIQEQLILKILPLSLEQEYPTLSQAIASYLVTKININPEACLLLYKQLFEHNWETPCELSISSIKPKSP